MKKPYKILYSCFWAVILTTGIFRAETFATDVTDPTLDVTVTTIPTAEPTVVDVPEPDIPDTTVITTPTAGTTATETPDQDDVVTTIPAEQPMITDGPVPDEIISVTPEPTPSIVPDQKQVTVSEAAQQEASNSPVPPAPDGASYIITIPEKIDFGMLTQPDSDTDSWITCRFSLTAELTGFSEEQAVQISMKDSSFSDGEFYLTQEAVQNPFRLSYDIYKGQPTSDTLIKNGTYDNDSGYVLCEFIPGVLSQDVTLSLNQRALYGKDLNMISGDYTGHITFHSRLVTDAKGI